MRHQLAETIDLTVRHFQNATDIAQHSACLQGSECDDLGYLIPPVLSLHIADHLFTAVLTEVDIEVGHRNAIRVEEAFEKQREPQRIDVGNRQRIGDERTGTRATARPDRNAMGFRPFDKVRNDQEVARELHAGDDADLVFETLGILLCRIAFCETDGLQAHLQAFAGLPRQLVGFLLNGGLRVIGFAGKPRQDRCTGLRVPAATLCNFDGVVECFRQIGKKCSHFRTAFHVMVRRQTAAVIV